MAETPESESGLLRKYRELLEKHERLVARLEEGTAERMVVLRLARVVLRSRGLGIATFVDGSVVSANPAWRALGDQPGLREWRLYVDEMKIFATLDAAACALAERNDPAWQQLVRIGDGHRVRLRVEVVEEEGGASTLLAVAIDERAAAVRVHHARNHLAAAVLQTRLLRDENDAGPMARQRAASIAELLLLAGAALDPPAPDSDPKRNDST